MLLKTLRTKSKPITVAAILICGAAMLWFGYTFLDSERNNLADESAPLTNTLEVVGPTMPPMEPVSLRIAAIDLAVPFGAPLGLNEDGTVGVPDDYEQVGYYAYGPTPGELGPAVVLGHVDSYEGPAIFYSLGQLSVGDEIEIERLDNSVAVFEVTKLERHQQGAFPTEAVYGNINFAGLRLITCSGTFDRGEQRYSHNLVVFAKLKTVR